jgi:hypothetical protein
MWVLEARIEPMGWVNGGWLATHEDVATSCEEDAS